jgi:putative transposase
MLVAERFIAYLIDKYGKHPISTDGGTWYPPQACQFLQLDHHIHSFYEKSYQKENSIKYIRIEPKNTLMIIFRAKERNVN